MKSQIVLVGHRGIGDNIHQRAACRGLLRRGMDVWIETPLFQPYHDLIDQGLKLIFRGTPLHSQGRQIEQERGLWATRYFPLPAPNAAKINIQYLKPAIDRYGSILATMVGHAGLDPALAEDMDFSLPIRPDWKARADEMIATWASARAGRPLMIYRPISFRPEWSPGEARNPDPDAYEAIFNAARDGFFVVSVADLVANKEWIVGREQPADVKLHGGELDFPILAALFAAADLVVSAAGFGPVLAQAVGTPSIVVYGGRESFRTTDQAGEHLAPTLGIDPIKPCDQHNLCRCRGARACDKTIDVGAAIERIRAFVNKIREIEMPLGSTEKPVGGVLPVEAIDLAAASATPALAEISQSSPPPAPSVETRPPRRLIFGTVFVDSEPKKTLVNQWIDLTRALNPDCDLLLVDSASPIRPFIDEAKHGAFARHEPGMRAPLMLHDFGDNIGHLSRGGRDGWGRAFCYGLDAAVSGDYDYVAHIEGDSLCRLPFGPIFDEMARDGVQAATTSVQSGPRTLPRWVETGLMAFSVDFLKRFGLVARYDWPRRQRMPTPEVVLGDLLRGVVKMMGWRAYRADKDRGTIQPIVNHANVVQHGFDWITHFHNDIWAYDRFFEAAMAGRKVSQPIAVVRSSETAAPAEAVSEPVATAALAAPSAAPPAGPSIVPSRDLRAIERPLVKINLGCGTNKLAGWENHDKDVDITKPLPWPADHADFIFIEHCVEHVDWRQAVEFFKEALRVLRPSGVLRVTMPSIEQIEARDDPDYWRFTTKWQSLGATKRGAMHAILYAHGHQAPWTASVLRSLLFYAGFDDRRECRPGESEHEALRGVEGHGKVIGDRFNDLESMCFEATKPGVLIFSTSFEAPKSNARADVAIIIGGARDVDKEIALARALCADAGVVPEFFAINDAIASWPEECVAVTVSHGHRMPGRHGGLRGTPHGGPGWLDEREKAGFPTPREVYCISQYPSVTKVLREWINGSSGLYAIRCARDRGHDRIIGCGVPMTEEGGHVRHGQIWASATGFRRNWDAYKQDIAPFFRSFSGWTAEQFGTPTVDFLRGRAKEAAE